MRNFKRILCTTLAFLLLIAVISIGFMEVYFRAELDFFQDGSDRQAEAGSVDCIVCGSSHAFRAFQPDVMDAILGTHTYNLSGALLSMRGRYELLAEEVERNPVKTVILEVSYNSLTRTRGTDGIEGDLYLLARTSKFTDRVRLFFSLFSAGELPDVYYKFVSEGIDAAGDLLKGKKANYTGERIRGYYATGERVEEINTNYTEHFHEKSLTQRLEATNLDYLDRIMKLCQEREIRVVIVTTPITLSMFCEYNNYDWFCDWYREYAKKWNASFVDFNLYKGKETLFPDLTMFYDRTHLNKAGSELFSRIFAEVELKLRAGEDVSELFYKSYYTMQKALGF